VSRQASDVQLEEIEVTGTEKVLALVLTVFFLIGGIWVYSKLDEVRESTYRNPETFYTATERANVARAEQARIRLSRVQHDLELRREELELSRESYRTALDAGRKAPGLRAAYAAAQRDFRTAQRQLASAGAELTAAEPAANAAYERTEAAAARSTRQGELETFALRLAFLLVALALAHWFLLRLRSSGSRYLPVGFALVAAGAILALAFTADYVTDYIDVQQLGPLVLSLAGIAITLAAFWWLQRYLARRLPLRRVRKGECPFCGFPLRGGEHCEGCGRNVVAECVTCHEPRRVGAAHCGACGVA
jgi:hypothetical protein